MKAFSSVADIKQSLATELLGIIARKGWNQTEAANALGVTQPRISDLKNYKLERFSIDSVTEMIMLTGWKVECGVSAKRIKR